MARRATFYCSKARCERQWINVHRKRCDLCGGENTRLKRVKASERATVLVTPDVPEHFNLSLNCRVRSRRHLVDLQKRMGTQDYEGINGANLRQVFTEGGHRQSVSRAR